MKKNLTDTGAMIVMQSALKIAISVCMKCRQNSAGDTYKKFTGMIVECQAMKKQLTDGEYLPTETNGDGLQIALLAYDVLCNEIDRDMTETDEKYISFSLWSRLKTPHKHIDKRVKIQDMSSAAFKTEMLSPAQIAYRECRKYIEQHTAPDTRRQKCFYFADLAKLTDENGLTYKEMIYTEKRYSDDIDRYDTATIDGVIELLNLTKTQNDILTLRLRGYGYKAIGTYYGKSKQAVAKTMAQIQKKFLDIFKLDENESLFAMFAAMFETETETETTETETETTETETDGKKANTYTVKQWHNATAFDDYF